MTEDQSPDRSERRRCERIQEEIANLSESNLRRIKALATPPDPRLAIELSAAEFIGIRLELVIEQLYGKLTEEAPCEKRLAFELEFEKTIDRALADPEEMQNKAMLVAGTPAEKTLLIPNQQKR